MYKSLHGGVHRSKLTIRSGLLGITVESPTQENSCMFGPGRLVFQRFSVPCQTGAFRLMRRCGGGPILGRIGRCTLRLRRPRWRGAWQKWRIWNGFRRLGSSGGRTRMLGCRSLVLRFCPSRNRGCYWSVAVEAVTGKESIESIKVYYHWCRRRHYLMQIVAVKCTKHGSPNHLICTPSQNAG